MKVQHNMCFPITCALLRAGRATFVSHNNGTNMFFQANDSEVK